MMAATTKFGAYEILYELKSGGMGAVLLGRRRGPGAGGAVPAAEVRGGIAEHDHRWGEPAAEPRSIVPVVARAELADERGFEGGLEVCGGGCRSGIDIEHRSHG